MLVVISHVIKDEGLGDGKVGGGWEERSGFEGLKEEVLVTG